MINRVVVNEFKKPNVIIGDASPNPLINSNVNSKVKTTKR
jgi:hypothetical protein